MRGPKERAKLSLEDYADFFENIHRPDFTVDQLNQIIFMHGFSKRSMKKKDMLESLERLELMKPTRSTLQEDISYGTSLTLEEVKKDIDSIGWLECPIGSVQTTDPTSADATLALSSANELCYSATGATPEKKRRGLTATKKTRQLASTDLLLPS